MEALLSENEMLQGKLHSQEEDFRLQNSTLMTELSKVTLTLWLFLLTTYRIHNFYLIDTVTTQEVFRNSTNISTEVDNTVILF